MVTMENLMAEKKAEGMKRKAAIQISVGENQFRLEDNEYLSVLRSQNRAGSISHPQVPGRWTGKLAWWCQA